MMLTFAGAALGSLVALGVHVLFRVLRERAFMLVTVIGWVLAAFTLAEAALMVLVGLVALTDPQATMSLFWVLLGVMMLAALAICAGIGLRHEKVLGTPWLKAFGVMVSESCAALFVAILIHGQESLIADWLRQGTDTRSFLDSLYQARELLFSIYSALAVALVLLEIFGHSLRRSRSE